ncbi:MAG: ribosomal protein S18-alanine N-acetyltransferase [Paracoccaceae bacterium]|nr:ribosomal protein S18-alanine N-acetyltransferase [Paracoccaceae bacterium]MDG2257510.1 ribosomal protein S18-alanine N-acetyltransferase [Paracoccaceae bacterium]
MTPAGMAEIHAAAFTTQRPWTEQEIKDLLNASTTFSVEVNDHSFAIGQAVAGEAELLTIATDPNFQRQGHGRTCLKKFISLAKSNNAGTIFLEVDENNAVAIALYEDAGFKAVSRRKAYYKLPNGARSDAIQMVLTC